MKGIILAGGKGTRLYPITKAVSKQLLPIYDKPLIYYPLSVLLLGSIKDILIITTQNDLDSYKKILGDGSQLGINLSYAVQENPNGIGEAFIIGEKFIGADSVCLILGDNLFYGQELTSVLIDSFGKNEGATIFGYHVSNPSDYGVANIKNGKLVSLEEKPKNPKSDLAIPGLYVYDNSVVQIAKKVMPSKRGEIEITTINNEYLKRNKIRFIEFGRGMTWLDTGTPSGILLASEFVQTIQSRQGLYVSCIEEIAWRRGFISRDDLIRIGNEYSMTDYGQYLLKVSKY